MSWCSPLQHPRTLSLVGSPLQTYSSLKPTSHMSSQLENLNFLPGLPHLYAALMDPMQNDHNNLLVTFDTPSFKILTYLHDEVA
jgi:hypothetical protein